MNMVGRLALLVLVLASQPVRATEQKGEKPDVAKRARAPRRPAGAKRTHEESPRARVEALGRLRTGRSAVPFTEPGGGDPWPLRIFEKLDRARKSDRR